MSERQIIRDNTFARLSTSITGAQVFNSRVNPVRSIDTPAINVYIENETYEFITQRSFKTELTIVIDCVVFASPNWQDALDDLIDQITQILLSDSTYYDVVGNIPSFDISTTYEGEGEKPLARGIITFNFEYQTEFEPVITDAFTGADVDVDMIEPFDVNAVPTGEQGPDGKIDVSFTSDPEQ